MGGLLVHDHVLKDMLMDMTGAAAPRQAAEIVEREWVKRRKSEKEREERRR